MEADAIVCGPPAAPARRDDDDGIVVPPGARPAPLRSGNPSGRPRRAPGEQSFGAWLISERTALAVAILRWEFKDPGESHQVVGVGGWGLATRIA